MSQRVYANSPSPKDKQGRDAHPTCCRLRSYQDSGLISTAARLPPTAAQAVAHLAAPRDVAPVYFLSGGPAAVLSLIRSPGRLRGQEKLLAVAADPPGLTCRPAAFT